MHTTKVGLGQPVNPSTLSSLCAPLMGPVHSLNTFFNIYPPNGKQGNILQRRVTMSECIYSVGKVLKKHNDSYPLLLGNFNVNPGKNASDIRPWMYGISEMQPAKSKHITKSAKGFGSKYFLKLAMLYTGNSHACILNTPLESSKLPDDWTNARMTPFFKDGENLIK